MAYLFDNEHICFMLIMLVSYKINMGLRLTKCTCRYMKEKCIHNFLFYDKEGVTNQMRKTRKRLFNGLAGS